MKCVSIGFITEMTKAKEKLIYIVLYLIKACSGPLLAQKLAQINYVIMTAISSKRKYQKLAVVVHILQSAQTLIITHCFVGRDS